MDNFERRLYHQRELRFGNDELLREAQRDLDHGPPAPVCGPMLFGVGSVGGAVGAALCGVVWPLYGSRVVGTAIGGTGAMMLYAHLAEDVVTWKGVAAVATAADTALASEGF